MLLTSAHLGSMSHEAVLFLAFHPSLYIGSRLGAAQNTLLFSSIPVGITFDLVSTFSCCWWHTIWLFVYFIDIMNLCLLSWLWAIAPPSLELPEQSNTIGVLEEQKYLTLGFWRLKIRSHGIDRAMVPLEPVKEDSSMPFPASSCPSICIY